MTECRSNRNYLWLGSNLNIYKKTDDVFYALVLIYIEFL